jgi:hypothetical protein
MKKGNVSKKIATKSEVKCGSTGKTKTSKIKESGIPNLLKNRPFNISFY